MRAFSLERIFGLVQARQFDARLAPCATGKGRADFIEIQIQSAVAPDEGTWSDGDTPVVASEVGRAALGHGPASAGAVERDVEGAMVLRWRAAAAAARECVIGREDAADEDDDRQAELPVIAERVDIPPGIAARRDRAREARSCISARAASRPEIAAIGTPAPGCALPPAT